MFKGNIIVFQILNANKVELCCPGYTLDNFPLKKMHHDGLRGTSDFLILKSPHSRNTIVNYWSNLDHSIEHETGLFKVIKDTLLQMCL